MSEEPGPGPPATPVGAISAAEERFDRKRRSLGLFLGPVLFLVLLLVPPAGLSPAGGKLLAVVALTVAWWVTEPVPLPVTAVLGPALTVVLGVTPPKDAFAPFGDPVIFLFLGSFLLAEAMSAHGVDRRIALSLLSTRVFGSSLPRLVAGFALLSAALSMWLSNTATTAMLYPIALGVLAALPSAGTGPGEAAGAGRAAGVALLLACAYGSSIGGIGTPVGTPPNLIALGQLETLAGVRIPFFRWMAMAVPLAAVVLAFLVVYLAWPLRSRGLPLAAARPALVEERRAQGAWTRGQRNVVLVFAATVALWILPGLLAAVSGPGGRAEKLAAALPEAVVAALGGAALFALPVSWRERRFTLSWAEAVRIDWGTLLLFGGGLSLGGSMFRTGLAEALGHGLVGVTGARTEVGLVFLFGVVAICLTEVTSNTATATMVVPLAIATARAAGVDPLGPALAAGIACSMAFMLPVSTPPNAIVYGSGRIRITEMAKAGVLLDLACCVLVPLGVLLLARLLPR